MKKRTIWLLIVAAFLTLGSFILLVSLSNPTVFAQQQPTPTPTPAIVDGCEQELPNVEFLGAGAGEYTLPAGFEVFIVKRLPFAFVLESGTVTDQGTTVYQAAQRERVWACSGDCGLPAVYHAAFRLGDFAPGTTLNLVVIDDDIDDRINWFAANDPLEPYQRVEEQALVENLSFTVPFTATWYYYAEDSIGVVATCFSPSTETPTPTSTEPTTATPTATGTGALTATPTGAATATPTPTTAAATTTATATTQPIASPTTTPTGSLTPPLPPPPPTVTDTPTPTPTQGEPTSLGETPEPNLSTDNLLFLPIIAN